MILLYCSDDGSNGPRFVKLFKYNCNFYVRVLGWFEVRYKLETYRNNWLSSKVPYRILRTESVLNRCWGMRRPNCECVILFWMKRNDEYFVLSIFAEVCHLRILPVVCKRNTFISRDVNIINNILCKIQNSI